MRNLFDGHLRASPMAQAQPLWKRAWTFQERLLAPRIIHFCSQEIISECNAGLWCECSGHFGFNCFNWAKQKYHNTSLHHGGQRVFTWNKPIEEYSSQKLTYASDRLIAISSLAQQISQKQLGRYFAGLWECRFIESLCWKAVSLSEPQSGTSHAPSWS
jgi:hypothetical protein